MSTTDTTGDLYIPGQDDTSADLRDIAAALLHLLYVVEETLPRSVDHRVAGALADAWEATRRIQERHRSKVAPLWPDLTVPPGPVTYKVTYVDKDGQEIQAPAAPPGCETPEPHVASNDTDDPGWIAIEVADCRSNNATGTMGERVRAATIVSVYDGGNHETVIRVMGGTLYVALNTTVREVLRKVDEALRP